MFGSCAGAAIWPDQLGTYERKSASELRDQSAPDEYGREAAEEADYGAFKVTGIRFKDSTGAWAASLSFICAASICAASLRLLTGAAT